MNIKRLFSKILKNGDRKTVRPTKGPSPETGEDPTGRTHRRPGILKGTSASRRTGTAETTKVRRRGRGNVQDQWIFTVCNGIDRGRQFVGVTVEIRLGRQPENHILLRDPKVSRFHAVIRRKGRQLYLEDLGSTNGTFVNGERVSARKRLAPGDRIKIGETVLEVRLDPLESGY